MRIILFLFINSILLYSSRNIKVYKKFLNLRKLNEGDSSDIDNFTEEIDSTNEETTDITTNWNSTPNKTQTLLLLGFDRYQYNSTNKLIQFYTYIKIEGLDIDNISFPISIKSNRRIRNLEEKEVNITGIKEGNMNDDKNIFFFNCRGEYNKTPSKVEFLKDEDFYINGNKTNLSLELTPYAQYLGSNIQNQISSNSYLSKDPIIFKNSKIINQNKNIIIEGEYHGNYSENAYLFSKEGKDNHIPCTMEPKVGEYNIHFLNCKPSSSFKDDLNNYLVNLKDINRLMFFDFNENDSIVDCPIEKEKDSSKKISAGIIVLIIFVCIAVLAILGVAFYCMRKRSFQSNQTRDKNNNTLGVNQYNSSSNITN